MKLIDGASTRALRVVPDERAWSLLDLAVSCLVYPRPEPCDLDWLLANQQHSGTTQTIEQPWAHSFVAGLVPPATVETASG